MDLVEFLTARLDEDERAARAARPGPWSVDGSSVIATHPTDEVVDYTESADHIARHDPARVLREVGAKRSLIQRYKQPEESPDLPRSFNKLTAGVERAVLDEVFRSLALPYADHPDYDEAWRP